MGSITRNEVKPHAVCIPYPAQGHITPMLKLAKLLHQKGFNITFVNTEYNHRRLLTSRALVALDGLPGFCFATIPDGLPESDANVTQDVAALCESTTRTCLEPFYKLLLGINSSEVPPVSCIVSDGCMSFTLEAAERLRLPEVVFWTPSACSVLAYTQFKHLKERGFMPLKDMNQITNGYLETFVDGVPGMKDIRLRDFPSLVRTTNANDFMFNFAIQETEAIYKAKALILNTFDVLEHDVVDALSSMFSPVYTLGPLQLMMNYVDDKRLEVFNSTLWKENLDCLKWLDTKEPETVLYVNFGSVAVVTVEQLNEFAWGLANSKKTFLWIIRPDLVTGDSAVLPPEFVSETKNRSMLASWCPQEQVLKHPAIGGFLTHNGWNSTLETIVGGVPVLCWPFFADQQTNCRYCCVEWGFGIEIGNNVKRDEVETVVKELIDGEKGKTMKAKAMDWKRKAEEATQPGGSSYLNFEKLVKQLQG